MSKDNNHGSIVENIANALHVSVDTFTLIISIAVVLIFSCMFAKEMFMSNDVKDIYMNWDSIIYVSDYYDEKKEEQCVHVTIEETRGFPYGITITKLELMQSKACPVIISSSVTVPQMQGNTLVLPPHFDSVYGFVREYNKKLQEEE